MNCAEPANTNSDMPMTAAGESPAFSATTPKITPNGIAPTIIGTVSRAPASSAARGEVSLAAMSLAGSACAPGDAATVADAAPVRGSSRFIAMPRDVAAEALPRGYQSRGPHEASKTRSQASRHARDTPRSSSRCQPSPV